MIASLAPARGMTTSQVADRMGIHRNRLADKIAGRIAFKESDILAAAEVLGVSPGRLFEDPFVLLSGESVSAWTTFMLVSPALALAA